jgi:hypothetical protein
VGHSRNLKNVHDVDSVSFVRRDIKGHNLAANVCIFVHRKLDGNLAETVGCERRKPFHFPQFTSLNLLPSFSL